MNTVEINNASLFQQSLEVLEDSYEAKIEFPSVPQAIYVRRNQPETELDGMNGLEGELLQFPSCPTIPKTYPRLSASPQKQNIVGIMMASNLQLPFPEEQDEL